MPRLAPPAFVLLLATLPFAVASAAQTAKPAATPKTWKCSASGLVSATYAGGDGAYVHLSGFSYGGTYTVTKDKTGTIATGTTANGTKFTCTLS